MKAKPTCKNCPDREVGCHADCERYKKFKQEMQAEKDARAKAIALDNLRIKRGKHR